MRFNLTGTGFALVSPDSEGDTTSVRTDIKPSSFGMDIEDGKYELHQGMVIVGVPYVEQGLMKMDKISGGTPYGASTMAGGDGSRQPSENELAIARFQGRHTTEIAKKLAAK